MGLTTSTDSFVYLVALKQTSSSQLQNIDPQWRLSTADLPTASSTFTLAGIRLKQACRTTPITGIRLLYLLGFLLINGQKALDRRFTQTTGTTPRPTHQWEPRI